MKDNIKYHAIVLSDEDQDRLEKVTTKTIDFITNKTNNVQEQALVLRILMESFEETQKCVVPFKNRYTEPIWNYDKNLIDN